MPVCSNSWKSLLRKKQIKIQRLLQPRIAQGVAAEESEPYPSEPESLSETVARRLVKLLAAQQVNAFGIEGVRRNGLILNGYRPDMRC